MTNSYIDYFLMLVFVLMMGSMILGSAFTLLLLLVALIFLVLIDYTDSWYSVFLLVDKWKMFMMMAVMITFLMVLFFISDNKFEIYMLNFMVVLGSIILMVSNELVLVYLGMEMQTFSILILMSSNKHSIKSSEASLKYFILGALSSGVFLLGLCLIFANGMSTNIKDIGMMSNIDESLLKFYNLLLCVSLFFKLSLFPFHFWIPDMYEGSSWEVMFLLAMMSKISIMTLLIQLIGLANLFVLSGMLSMLVGTVGAFSQTKIKSLMAYGGMSHMGFVMLAMSLFSNEGYESGLIYLFVYTITFLGIFMMSFMTNFSSNSYMIELSGSYSYVKLMGLSWMMMLFSMAGIPPLLGFMSKWMVIWNILLWGNLWSSMICMMFSMVSAGYYLSVMKMMFFQKKLSYLFWLNVLELSNSNYDMMFIMLGFIMYLIMFLMLNPNVFMIVTHLKLDYMF